MFSKETIKTQPVDFRIGAIISDGMWYSQQKWRKLAKVSDTELNEWIKEALATGELLQSPSGAKSYRFPLKSILNWYETHNLDLNEQLVDYLFPPRIWDDQTETEGFLSAPLREVGIVSFSCTSEQAAEVAEATRGVARVREAEPGRYKAYCLSSQYLKKIVEDVLRQSLGSTAPAKIYSRTEAKRRELVDFTPRFAEGLVLFYKNFGKTLVKREMSTIEVFLPDPEDQESQIILWVMTAIEKFDESASVPFSGYLDTVLRRWPYDLPAQHLGKDLSAFQRQRSRGIASLKKKFGDRNFTAAEIAEEIGIDQVKFNDLEIKHRTWNNERASTSLTWDDNSDEKITTQGVMYGTGPNEQGAKTIANGLSNSLIDVAIETGLYDDASTIISQMEKADIDLTKLESIDPDFISALAKHLNIGGEN